MAALLPGGHGPTGPNPRGVTMAVTKRCPVCGDDFVPVGRRQYCTDACRMVAYRCRRAAARPMLQLPPSTSRAPITIYECDACGSRRVGTQRCADCGLFARRVGIGGACPHCDEPVTVAELVGSEAVP
jgi:hypothetical protein